MGVCSCVKNYENVAIGWRYGQCMHTLWLLASLSNIYIKTSNSHSKEENVFSRLMWYNHSSSWQRVQRSSSAWRTLAISSSILHTASWYRSRWLDWCWMTFWATQAPTLRQDPSQALMPSGTLKIDQLDSIQGFGPSLKWASWLKSCFEGLRKDLFVNGAHPHLRK